MKTIFAVDNKWGLGKKNDLLFSLKEDMRHFVAHTKGKTVVMVTHEPDIAEQTKRILVMRDGKLVSDERR